MKALSYVCSLLLLLVSFSKTTKAVQEGDHVNNGADVGIDDAEATPENGRQLAGETQLQHFLFDCDEVPTDMYFRLFDFEFDAVQPTGGSVKERTLIVANDFGGFGAEELWRVRKTAVLEGGFFRRKTYNIVNLKSGLVIRSNEWPVKGITISQDRPDPNSLLDDWCFVNPKRNNNMDNMPGFPGFPGPIPAFPNIPGFPAAPVVDEKGVFYYIFNVAVPDLLIDESGGTLRMNNPDFSEQKQVWRLQPFVKTCPHYPTITITDPRCPTDQPTPAPVMAPPPKTGGGGKDTTRLVLWDAVDNKFIRVLSPVDTINLCDVGTKKLNIKATNPLAEKFFFELKDRITKESIVKLVDGKFPFFLGRFGRNVIPALSEAGRYSLIANPTPGEDDVRYKIDVKACRK